MAKTKFNIITSTCVPLPLENVDTDQIIPARFLKATTREEKFFGDNLFRDWRYNADGSLNKDFVLNQSTYSGQILVAGKTSVRVPVVNTLPGLLQDMVSAWWYPVSLPIFIKNNEFEITLCCRWLLPRSFCRSCLIR